MDLKELKKLINEEVQRVKQKNLLKEQGEEKREKTGLTGASRPTQKAKQRPSTLDELKNTLILLKQKINNIILDKNKANILKKIGGHTLSPFDYLYQISFPLKDIETQETQEIEETIREVISKTNNFSFPPDFSATNPNLDLEFEEVIKTIDQIMEKFSSVYYVEPSSLDDALEKLRRESDKVQRARQSRIDRERQIQRAKARIGREETSISSTGPTRIIPQPVQPIGKDEPTMVKRTR